MSSYENDHPSAAQPDAPDAGWGMDDLLDELYATGGEGLVLVDASGRRLLGEGIVEMMAGSLGRIKGGASEEYIARLSTATAEQVKQSGEDACSICQTTFQVLLDEEEHYHALDSPAVATENLGVVRIGQGCEHLFCRRDATRWLSKSNSCPLCRAVCDPSISSDSASPSGTSDGAQSQSPAQMMALLQTLLGGGDVPQGFGGGGGPTPREDSREEYSSMYS